MFNEEDKKKLYNILSRIIENTNVESRNHAQMSKKNVISEEQKTKYHINATLCTDCNYPVVECNDCTQNQGENKNKMCDKQCCHCDAYNDNFDDSIDRHSTWLCDICDCSDEEEELENNNDECNCDCESCNEEECCCTECDSCFNECNEDTIVYNFDCDELDIQSLDECKDIMLEILVEETMPMFGLINTSGQFIFDSKKYLISINIEYDFFESSMFDNVLEINNICILFCKAI